MKVKGGILIKTSNVDVLVIACYYFAYMNNTNEVWMDAANVSRSTDTLQFMACVRFLTQHFILKSSQWSML